MDALSRVERVLLSLLNSVRRLRLREHGLGERLLHESQEFWNSPSNPDLQVISHWRGHGPFADEAVWRGLGRRHVGLYERAARWTEEDRRPLRVVEWGSGGGLNAAAFEPLAEEYFGVDISAASLDETARQLHGRGRFVPILIDASEPEAVLEMIPRPCTLFLSTYVFELLPTPEYGRRVMDLVPRLLDAGGLGIVQVRYQPGAAPGARADRSYAEGWHRMTSYGIEEFWDICRSTGLEPLFVHLVPEEPVLNETRYAYFAMRKPG